MTFIAMSAARQFILSFLLLQLSFNLVIAIDTTNTQFADIVPKIIFNDDNVTNITRNVGEDLILNCQCLNHITWRHFNTTILSRGNITTNLRNFESTLHLKNISVHDVGYYYCMLTATRSGLNLDQDLDYAQELGEAARIYVYVNDPVNLLVPIRSRKIAGKLFSKIILPCKTSSESSEVELLLREGENLIAIPGVYDSRIGFTMELIDSSINQSTLICRVKGVEQPYFEIIVTIEPYVNFINNPIIQQLFKAVYDNEENYVILQCSVVVKKTDRIEIEWSNGYEKLSEKWETRTKSDDHVNITQLEVLQKQIVLKNATYADSGFYKCTVRSTVTNVQSSRSTFLDIWFKYKPELTTIQDYYIKAGENVTIDCKCQAYPPCSMVQWTYQPCQPSKESNCSLMDPMKIDWETSQTRTDITLRSMMTFKPPNSGIVHCTANNSVGKTIRDIHIWLDDRDTPFGIDATNLTETVLIRDNVTLTCFASIYNHTYLEWFRDSRLITSNDDFEVVLNDTKYSLRSQLTIKNISAQGLYECRTIIANTKDFRIEELRTKFSERTFIVVDPKIPQRVNIMDPNDSKQFLDYDQTLVLHCNASGMPEPKITWFKDKKIIQNDNMTLEISHMKEENSGHYECKATNRLNSVLKRTQVIVNAKPDLTKLISILGITLILLFCVVINISVRLHRARKLNKDWVDKWAKNFEKGKPENLDPNLSLGEQAALLPYYEGGLISFRPD